MIKKKLRSTKSLREDILSRQDKEHNLAHVDPHEARENRSQSLCMCVIHAIYTI